MRIDQATFALLHHSSAPRHQRQRRHRQHETPPLQRLGRPNEGRFQL